MGTRAIDELMRAGNEFRGRGDVVSAEPLLRRAVALADSPSRESDSERTLPNALNTLGMLCKDLARYDEARSLYERALAIVEQSPVRTDHDIAALFHNLGGIEHARRDFVAAEPLARRGVALRRGLGDSDALGADLIALAAILDGQRKFNEAEAVYLEGLALLERNPERNAGEIAVALNNLGAQYLLRDRVAEGLQLLAGAERLKRQSLGPHHPDLAVTLNNLAEARKFRGELAAAHHLYREAVDILEGALGSEHPKTAACRRNLSNLESLVMSSNNETRPEREMVRINLTTQQKEVVKAATNRDAEAIELTVEELEKRIAPFFRLAGNHNETLLADGRDKVRVQIELTDDQRTQIRDAFGEDAKGVELSVEPLEDRIAPIKAILISL